MVNNRDPTNKIRFELFQQKAKQVQEDRKKMKLMQKIIFEKEKEDQRRGANEQRAFESSQKASMLSKGRRSMARSQKPKIKEKEDNNLKLSPEQEAYLHYISNQMPEEFQS